MSAMQHSGLDRDEVGASLSPAELNRPMHQLLAMMEEVAWHTKSPRASEYRSKLMAPVLGLRRIHDVS